MRHFFERALLAALEPGGDGQRFTIPEHAHRALTRALDADLDGAFAEPALDAALRLAAAFDGKMRSPQLAALIRGWMRDNPRAVAVLIARRRAVSPIDAVRRFAEREGREAPARIAPAQPQIPARGRIASPHIEQRGRRSWQLKA